MVSITALSAAKRSHDLRFILPPERYHSCTDEFAFAPVLCHLDAAASKTGNGMGSDRASLAKNVARNAIAVFGIQDVLGLRC